MLDTNRRYSILFGTIEALMYLAIVKYAEHTRSNRDGNHHSKDIYISHKQLTLPYPELLLIPTNEWNQFFSQGPNFHVHLESEGSLNRRLYPFPTSTLFTDRCWSQLLLIDSIFGSLSLLSTPNIFYFNLRSFLDKTSATVIFSYDAFVEIHRSSVNYFDRTFAIVPESNSVSISVTFNLVGTTFNPVFTAVLGTAVLLSFESFLRIFLKDPQASSGTVWIRWTKLIPHRADASFNKIFFFLP